MKIKFCLPILLTLFLWVFAEDCSYLKNSETNQLDMNGVWQFNYEYPYQLCLLNSPIHDDALKYIQGIKDTKDKTVWETVHEVGNVFCRGYFGECDEDSFYGRFLASCEEARSKTREILKGNNTSEAVGAELIWFSYNGCPALADTYVTAYKEVGVEEVARYHSKTIESSNNSYLEKSHEKWDKLSGVRNTFIKTLSNWVKSIQGFTKYVFV